MHKHIVSRQLLTALVPWIVVAHAVSAAEEFQLLDGIPAADVLGSQDTWGNPSFIGGITNRGPDSQSVW
jgi:hypothetical protein